MPVTVLHPAARKDLLLLLALFVLCGALISITSFAYLAQPTYPSGDEPHYLVISQTLLKYHSLAVMQDYANRDYQTFYPSYLDPHIAYSIDGQPLPVHGIGGPILWLIPYDLFGRAGAVFFISLVTLLILLNIYQMLITLGIARYYAFLVSLAYGIASPLYIYSHLTFIEPIAALSCIYVFRKTLQERVSIAELIISSILLGILPWVHIRFALVEITLFFPLLYRLYRLYGRHSARHYVAYLLPVSIFCFAFELYNYFVWGSLNPAVNQVSMENQPFAASPFTGLVGLLFDQEYGLLINFPMFVFLLAGVAVALKKCVLSYHLLVLFVSLPYLLLITTLNDWTGGWCPPARFILVLLPIYAYYIAYALEWVDTLFARLTFGMLMLYGFCYNLQSIRDSFSHKIGQNLAIVNIHVFNHRLTYFLPSLFASAQKAEYMLSQRQLFLLWICLYIAVSLLVVCSKVIKFPKAR